MARAQGTQENRDTNRTGQRDRPLAQVKAAKGRKSIGLRLARERGLKVSSSFLLSAVALIAVGVVLGALAVVSLGIRHEERHFTLETGAGCPMARGARRLTGLSCFRIGPTDLGS
jgi:hypothetical protein